MQSTYCQEIIPKDPMGNVFGFQQFFDYVTIPAGIVFAVFADSLYGVAAGIELSGLIILAFAVAGLFARPLRNPNPVASSTSPPR